MATTPWTDSDPQPGDFDPELDRAGSNQIEIHEGNPSAKLSPLDSFEKRAAAHDHGHQPQRGHLPFPRDV